MCSRFRVPAASGRSRPVAASQPRWRRDGKELFYIAPDGKLMAAPIQGAGQTLEAAPRWRYSRRGSWAGASSESEAAVCGRARRPALPDQHHRRRVHRLAHHHRHQLDRRIEKMTLTAGSKLGPYEILAPIGAGGMGEVYRARDPRVGRDVAIKVSAEQFSERFEREIHAVAALNHSNICTLYDVGPNYLVMELVEGPTLADRIKQGAIPLEESLEIARQIADALEAAHEKGIVHRDLKPANIKIKPDGTVKVLDFGLAKVGGTPAVSSDNSPTLSVAQTAAGVILGTAAYMSPEQAKGKTVDKRADIWAFGVVLYEMLTGKQLFDGRDGFRHLGGSNQRGTGLGESPGQKCGGCCDDVWKKIRRSGCATSAMQCRCSKACPNSYPQLTPGSPGVQ